MKKFTKKIVVILTSLLLLSNMAIGASAAYVVEGATISDPNGSGCSGSFGTNTTSWSDFVNAGGSVYGRTYVIGASPNCPSSDYDLDSYISAALDQAKQTTNNTTSDQAGSPDCTAAAAAATPAAVAAETDTDNTAVAADPAPASASPDESTVSVPAETYDSSCATTAATTGQACQTTTNTADTGLFTFAGFTSCKQSFLDCVNSILAKCGFSVCLPDVSESDVTATPQPSNGTDTTAAPEDTGGNTTVTTPSDSGTTAAQQSDADNLAYEQQVVELVNEQRAANGLAPLTLSEQLSDVARLKSQDMLDNHYFDHVSPTYGSPFDMLSTFGISYRAAGENIAMGYATPQAVVTAWMNSPGHRANILNASYTQIGVGYVADGSYWTQEFIG